MYTPTQVRTVACVVKFIILCFFVVPRDSDSHKLLEITALLDGEENKWNASMPGSPMLY